MREPTDHASPNGRDSERQAVSAREAWGAIASFAPRHRAFLLQGLFLTLGGVAAQLSIPWPLKELLKGSPDAAWRSELPAWLSPPLAMGLLFFFLMSSAGFFDYLQRLAFARFAIGWSRDLRAAVHRAASTSSGPELHQGDLVARLIGDVARFKASVKVTLFYVASNGILFLAGCGIVWSIHVSFGIVFTTALGLAVLVGALGARRSFRDYHSYRKFEGELAVGLSDDGDFSAAMLDESGAAEASEVRQQSGAAWAAHVIMGAMVAGILVVGAQGIETGDVEASSLLLFLGYALFLSKPLVRLTRHGARVGKLVGGGIRLGQYLRLADTQKPGAGPGLSPQKSLEVSSSVGEAWNLPAKGLVELEGRRGQALLEALGELAGGKGELRVDGAKIAPQCVHVRAGRDSTWSIESLDRLGMQEPGLVARLRFAWTKLGLFELAERRSGLAVASNEVSSSERAAVALALLASADLPVAVIDRVDELLDDEGRSGLDRLQVELAQSRLVLVRSKLAGNRGPGQGAGSV